MHLYNLKSLRVPAALAAALAVLTFVWAAVPVQAQTPTTVYGFPGTPGPLNPNIEAIAQGRDGNLYLTAAGGDGGAVDCTTTYCGTAFKMTTSGAVTDVFDFTNGGCPASFCGTAAYGGLTLGADGNFYGATYNGGTTSNNGTVFKLTPTGVATALHNFTGAGDGSHPYGSPIQAANGIFYGTTTSATVADSTAYSVTSAGVFTTIHTFTGADGQNVYAPLVQGTDGNFYGDSAAGGTSNDGVIFKMTPGGTVTVLHNFAGTDGSNGSFPLIQASDGNFYGSTYSGGTFGAGVIFKITSGGVYTVLHNINGTTEGNGPWGALVQATNGKLYGITSNMEIGLYGTIFSITTSGTFTTLYSFTDGADGGDPLSPLIQHTDGLLYGTTNVGGDTNCYSAVNINGQENIVIGCGELYSLNIAAKPFVRLVTTSGKVGSKIGILGQGFSSASVVKFGGGVKASAITLTGTTFILATVPAGATDGKVTVTTGATALTSAQKFIVHDSWSAGAVMPTAVQAAATGVIGSKVYVVGGATSSSVVATNQIYTPGTNSWTTGAPMPTARFAAAAAVVDNTLYVIGGNPNGSSQLSVVEAYSPTTNTWSTKSSMPTARDSIAAAVEGGKIYVVGGYDSTNGRLATVESYNPATDTWTEEKPLTVAKSYPAVGLLGTTIVAAGGLTNSGTTTGDNEGYKATTNLWSTLTPDPTIRQAPCNAPLAGFLYSAGGSNSVVLSVNESFNVTTDKWTTLTAMPLAVVAPGSANVSNLLYCFGGSNNGALFAGTVYDNVQIYQP